MAERRDDFLSELAAFELSTQEVLRYLEEEHVVARRKLENHTNDEDNVQVSDLRLRQLQLNLNILDHKLLIENTKLDRVRARIHDVESSMAAGTDDTTAAVTPPVMPVPSLVPPLAVVVATAANIQDFVSALEEDEEIMALKTAVRAFEDMMIAGADGSGARVGADGQLEAEDDDQASLVQTYTLNSPNEFIDGILRDPASVAHVNVNCYAKRLHAFVDSPHTIDEYDRLHARSCSLRQHVDAYLDTQAYDVRGFVTSLAEGLYMSYCAECQCSMDTVELTVENYVFGIVYDDCMRLVTQKDDDRLLSEQCQAFSFVTQGQLFVDECYQSSESQPFIMPISSLRRLAAGASTRQTPSKKMDICFEAARSVLSTIDNHARGVVVGGDDFLPIWIYVVLHARLPNLASTIAYVREFAHPMLMQTELGYYFSSLELAAEFIKTLSEDKLNNPASAVRDVPFVVTERTNAIQWAQLHDYVDVVRASAVLPGFRAYALLERLWNQPRFQQTVVEETGNADDKMLVSVLKINARATRAQEDLIETFFFKPSRMRALRPIETDLGVLLVCEHPLPTFKCLLSEVVGRPSAVSDDAAVVAAVADAAAGDAGDADSSLAQSSLWEVTDRANGDTAVWMAPVAAEWDPLSLGGGDDSTAPKTPTSRSRTASSVTNVSDGGTPSTPHAATPGKPEAPGSEMSAPVRHLALPKGTTLPPPPRRLTVGGTGDRLHQVVASESTASTLSPMRAAAAAVPRRRSTVTDEDTSTAAVDAQSGADVTGRRASLAVPMPRAGRKSAAPTNLFRSPDVNRRSVLRAMLEDEEEAFQSGGPAAAAADDADDLIVDEFVGHVDGATTLPPTPALDAAPSSERDSVSGDDLGRMRAHSDMFLPDSPPSGSHVIDATMNDPIVRPNSFDMLSLVLLPDGDFDGNLDTIMLQLHLQRVGCTRRDEELYARLPRFLENRFRKLYQFHVPMGLVSFRDALANLIVEVQLTLQHLDMFSGAVNSLYSDRLLDAVRNFQADSRWFRRSGGSDDVLTPHVLASLAAASREGSVARLESMASTDSLLSKSVDDISPAGEQERRRDGILDPASLLAMRARLAYLRELLEAAGFRSKDPIRHAPQFRSAVKSYQGAVGTAQTGRLNVPTCTSLGDELSSETVEAVAGQQTSSTS